MKTLVLNIALILICLNSQGQSVKLDWFHTAGSQTNSNDFCTDIVYDTFGNIYVIGTFFGTIDLDPSQAVYNVTSIGVSDVFILKLDTSGTFVWAKTIGGNGYDYSSAITVDSLGNTYSTGHFHNTVDFDPDSGVSYLNSQGSFDVFILKLNPLGKLEWARSVGGQAQDESDDISLDQQGNIIIAGVFRQTADFDPGPALYNLTGNFSRDVFILKLDSNANFLWAKSFGGSAYEYCNAISIDANNGISVIGSFGNTVDFDPDTSTHLVTAIGQYDIYILKLDFNGQYVWARTYGSSGRDFGKAVCTDNNSNIVIAGYFTNTVNFNPGGPSMNLTSNGGDDIFIQKIDATGNPIWLRHIGGDYDDEAHSLKCDDSGNIYLSGNFSRPVDFDPESGTMYINPKLWGGGYALKLHPFGGLYWAKAIETSSVCLVDGLEIVNDNIYLAGGYWGISDFDPSTNTLLDTSIGQYDIYITKLKPCWPNGGYIDTVVACNNYRWIDGIVYTSSTNQSRTVLTNVSGCDSIVNLNLTINNINNGIQSSDTSLRASGSGIQYQWLDCINYFAPLPGDTNRLLFPATSGSYAVQVSSSNCVDTSKCLYVVFPGTSEINAVENISLWPNPTSDYLNVLFAEPTNAQFRIFSMTGKILYESQMVNSKSHKIDLRKSSGLHILQISGIDFLRHYKILVQSF